MQFWQCPYCQCVIGPAYELDVYMAALTHQLIAHDKECLEEKREILRKSIISNEDADFLNGLHIQW